MNQLGKKYSSCNRVKANKKKCKFIQIFLPSWDSAIRSKIFTKQISGAWYLSCALQPLKIVETIRSNWTYATACIDTTLKLNLTVSLSLSESYRIYIELCTFFPTSLVSQRNQTRIFQVQIRLILRQENHSNEMRNMEIFMFFRDSILGFRAAHFVD